jgi:hypothetical protein
MSDDKPFDPPGELLFEFYVSSTQKPYRVELRDHGKTDGVEAQFLDPVDVLFARTFRPELDPTGTPRALAVRWAIEEIKATLRCPTCRQACGWTCEAHPGTPWPHNVDGERCAGPADRCSNPACPWWVGTAPLAHRRDEWRSLFASTRSEVRGA